MYKLIISDLDGTLVDSNKNISSFTKKVIDQIQEKGIEFVIATGRSYKGAKKIADILNLKTEIICNNGASIYDAHGNLIFQKLIDKKVARNIYEKIKNTDSIFFASYEDKIFIDQGRIDESREFLLNPPENAIEVTSDNIEKFSFEKIVILNKNHNILEEFTKELGDVKEIKSFISQDYFLDIVHYESSKGIALEFLAQLKNINLEETLAFGDAFNDYEMLKVAGKGIVMANGYNDLKSEFESHSLTNDENAVAIYLSDVFDLK